LHRPILLSFSPACLPTAEGQFLLSDLLTADVEVRIKKTVRRHGKQQEMGEIAIQFGSLDELNGLIEKLRGEA
jgi:hypothetical protein